MSNSLKGDSIGLIPPGGYLRSGKHSQEAVEWLLLEEKKLNGRSIQHAGNAREYHLIEGYPVDGFLPPHENEKKGTVF